MSNVSDHTVFLDEKVEFFYLLYDFLDFRKFCIFGQVLFLFTVYGIHLFPVKHSANVVQIETHPYSHL
jgi:hypothetical protein